MKIISNLVAISLAIAFTPPAKANPAILAPAAVCVGTAGVGCVFVGTALIGGVVYYVWQNTRSNKKFYADKSGNVRKMLVDPEDPEGSMRVPANGAFYARGQKEADNKCISKGFRRAVKKKDVTSKDGKYYVCV